MTQFRFSTEALSASVGDIFYLHDKEYSKTTSYEVGDRAAIRLMLPRSLGVDVAELRFIGDRYHDIPTPAPGVWGGFDSIFDIYEFKLGILEKTTIDFFCFELNSVFGKIYAFSLDNRVSFTTDIGSVNAFQISVSDFKYHATTLNGGVIYHIFVDRFARGGVVPIKEGAILVDDWSDGVPEFPEYPGAPLKNNTFYGGTLYGVIDKLNYISSLGVNLIYLSPIFDAASNHKYDTGDYMKVDEMFGSDKALRELILAADKYGIKIILDGVFNHTGDDSIYFNRYGNYDSLGAAQSTSSPYYQWYDFQSFPDKYTCWWGIDILPRINPEVEECGKYFVGVGGVIEKYAKMGIGGFRLDVVDELSDNFVSKIKEKLNEHNPNSILYGEVWEDASNKIAYGIRKTYYLGSELDGVMNYPLRTGIINYINEKSTGDLNYALTDIINNAPERIRNTQMNLLGTHDTQRILTVLGAEKPDGVPNSVLRNKRMSSLERERAIVKLKAAYTLLATLPGIPTVFYGDEAGLEGYSDPFNRMPYPWGKEEKRLIEHYRKLGRLRIENSVYQNGKFKLLYLDKNLLIYSRYLSDKAYVTIFNNSENILKLDLPKSAKPLLGAFEGSLEPLDAQVFLMAVNSTISLN